MSRHQSPSPAHPPSMLANQPYQLHAVPSTSASKQQKMKAFTSGITASAEDFKYQTKYKELKRKVKEIELDNDKLYLKLLLAKKNIRRMNLERAILYERLAAVPPTPGRHPQDLPPEQDPIFVPQQQQQPLQDQPRGPDVNDNSLADYMQSHPNARLVQGPDGRVVAIEETPPVDPRGPVALSGPPPPYGIPVVHNFQHESAPGFDPKRSSSALPTGAAPPGGIPSTHDSYEPPLSNTRSTAGHHAPSPAWAQEQPKAHSTNSSSSYHRDRGHHRHSRAPSSHGDIDPPSSEHNRETLPHTHRVRRPSISEGQGEGRSRRHDAHDLPHQHSHGHSHSHIQVSTSGVPTSPPPVHSPTSNRSTRMHSHQRVGPGAHIPQERDPDYEREMFRAREVEREEERERARELSVRMAMEEQELRNGGSWARDEAGLSGPGIPHGRSRSDTPGSGSGNGPSRPSSGQAYERERASRAYSSRNMLGIDSEYTYDPRDDRGHSSRMAHPEPSAADSRKRSRNDMEVDDDRDRVDPRYTAESSAGVGSAARMDETYPAAKESRVSKRSHHDDRDGQLQQVSSVRDEAPMDQDD